ncbi:type VI secretion system secreted protein VgrG [Ereboglobus sp. PH5-5]|uniref:type VI secretion system Vgr family protein n=1 Tax=Ereboglobus sp. PH5-5 TaxID=2940529 RepID=UPI002405A73A|nr:type VI secretion system tip protein TssI/VgrG [Ereboglobus sp. PH5-5]MDF9832757.1 type VI secretion system secreted protein VgrG [Ereboglobus sp. PH5-5]
MSDYTQDNRLLRITTPLGKDKLLLKSIRGVERLSTLFEYEARMLSEDNNIDYKDVLGKDVTIEIESAIKDGGTRYINGIVRSFGRTGSTGALARYVAVIVPKLWLTSLTTDCRIFQKKDTKTILSDIIKTDAGISDYKDSASDSGSTERPYCVQYRESDLAFASRLMEEEGIYYHFEHADGKHTLVLCDSPGSHSDASDAATIAFHSKRLIRGEQGIQSWGVLSNAIPGNYVLADYNYKSPSTVLRSNATESRGYTGDDAEMFDYPGIFAESTDGDKLAKIRLGAHQATHNTYTGTTTAVTLSTGTTFSLENHPNTAFNQKYLVIENEIFAENPPYTDGEPPAEATFQSRITAIIADQQYRAPQRTPIPDLRGPHSAIVTGAEDDEIHTDEYGCVKVRFHWDRDDEKKGEDSTVYLRTAQMWTGKNFGTLFIPRVGQEVIVEFLDGHPDRPVITGCLYNAENLPPYALPDHKTRSTIKTHSTPEGEVYNEVRFEDKKDEEQLLIHAGKDHEITTANDRVEHVGNDTHLTVLNDRLELIHKDHHEAIGGMHKLSIGAGAEGVEGPDGETKGEVEEGGGQHIMIKGPRVIEIGGKSSLKVTEDVAETFEKNHATAVTEQRYLKAKEIVLEAEENLTLHVGDHFIAITSDGIKISTTADIAINGDGSIASTSGGDITSEAGGKFGVTSTGDTTIEATGNFSAKGTSGAAVESDMNTDITAGINLTLEGTAKAAMHGAMAEVKSDAILTIQGSMVNIN